MTSAEAWFNVALRPKKPYGSIGRGAQDDHPDFHTAPELCCPFLSAVRYCSSSVRWRSSRCSVISEHKSETRMTASVVTKGDYPENLLALSCRYKQRSSEPFVCLDLISEQPRLSVAWPRAGLAQR